MPQLTKQKTYVLQVLSFGCSNRPTYFDAQKTVALKFSITGNVGRLQVVVVVKEQGSRDTLSSQNDPLVQVKSFVILIAPVEVLHLKY